MHTHIPDWWIIGKIFELGLNAPLPMLYNFIHAATAALMVRFQSEFIPHLMCTLVTLVHRGLYY
jgi:hypothetical protein